VNEFSYVAYMPCCLCRRTKCRDEAAGMFLKNCAYEKDFVWRGGDVG
jgi:hypothetical protein